MKNDSIIHNRSIGSNFDNEQYKKLIHLQDKINVSDKLRSTEIRVVNEFTSQNQRIL